MPPRKSGPKKPVSEVSASSVTTTNAMPTSDEKPQKLFVLPKTAFSPQTRLVTLRDPLDQGFGQYLCIPDCGFFELTKIGQTMDPQRSGLLVSAEPTSSSDDDPSAISVQEDGYILKDALIHVATPIDPLFFVLRLMVRSQADVERDRPVPPRAMDSLIDTLGQSSEHMAYLMRFPSMQKLVSSRIRDISEVAEVVGEEWYRLDPILLLEVLCQKADRLSHAGWPASLERSVQRRLKVPVSCTHEGANLEATSQEAITPRPVSDRLVSQLRLRVALQYIMAAYVPLQLRKHLETILASNAVIDFTELDEHLGHVEKLQSEVQAFRALSNNVSRKRKDADAVMEGDEPGAKRSKSQGKDEVKAQVESRATKELRKVNTSGMRKMSSFFAPKQAS